jgi:predicted RNase H-like nuclease (RuvC/YqgF family)
VKVKGMSDAAALELRRIDSFRDAEEEEILEAKKLVIESAPELTKKAISETIKSVSTEENWEDKYKFRFNPKPRKQTGEKPEKISREEVENVQNLNTLLRLQVSELQAENEELRKENENKILNEQFLSEQAQAIEAQLAQKEREIEQLKQELEEARQMRAIAG